MKKMTRRDFLATTTAAGAFSLLPSRPWARIVGANDDIRVAVAGFRSKGKGHIESFRRMKGVRVVALCDPDQAVLEREARRFRGRHETVNTYADVRELLEDDAVDAVVIATPHHWHALMTVWACQAGKDVYVEKPASHCVWEGRKMVEAARKHERIVQHGTQKRSDHGLRAAVEWLQAGHLGKITLSHGLCYRSRGSIGKVTAPQPIPQSIDYDLWAGPSPMKPLTRRRLHYDWHWFWETGNGDLGNQGIHEMDICRWFAGASAAAPRVFSVGGRFGYDDDGETPNTQFVYHDYDDIPILFEVRGLPMKSGMRALSHYKGIRVGNVIHCEGGHFSGGYAYDTKGKKVKKFRRDGGGGHAANFIKAVRSRKTSDLHADVLEGHLSSVLCHTGGVSHRLGRERPETEILEQIGNRPAALEAFERMKKHLDANKVDLKKVPAVAGAWLQMDPAQERFIGPLADEANALLKDSYRPPFVIPDQV